MSRRALGVPNRRGRHRDRMMGVAGLDEAEEDVRIEEDIHSPRPA